MDTPEVYLGLMSGTSLDGVDAVLVGFGGGETRLRHTLFRPFDAPLRQTLLALNRPGNNELETAAVAGIELARCYAEAVSALLEEASVAPEEVAAIGCHGQTVRHRPDLGFTLQINQPALLAELAGITVVADFRSRDIAAGGQGAPLVPAFHAGAFRHPGRNRAIVNIGGISNLTHLPTQGPVAGFDCGPGGLLLDGWCERNTGHPFDRNGEWAAGGAVIPVLLDKLLAHPFFRLPPPKSTGRDDFHLPWLESHLEAGYEPRNVQATLLELTACAVADAIHRFCPGTEEVFLCGGGAHNGALRRRLGTLLGIETGLTDDLGISADWVEATAFAWLAQQALLGRPGNLPEVTGARHPCLLGAIYPA